VKVTGEPWVPDSRCQQSTRTTDETLGQRQRAVEDLLAGLAAWRIWGHLARHDVRQRYRRSMLGPFWLTISIAVVALGHGMRIDVVGYRRWDGRERDAGLL
jgi:hypothetical protein